MTRRDRAQEEGKRRSQGGRWWAFRKRDAESAGHGRLGTAALAWGVPSTSLSGSSGGTSSPKGTTHRVRSPCTVCGWSLAWLSLYSETEVPPLSGRRGSWPLFWFQGHQTSPRLGRPALAGWGAPLRPAITVPQQGSSIVWGKAGAHCPQRATGKRCV